MISTRHTHEITTEAKEYFDYRESHKDLKRALIYEYSSSFYADGSFDSQLWGIEKSILLKEICLIRKNGIKYLDFACGTGRILSFVERYVSESTGVDISENMLKFTKNKIKKSLLLNCDLTKNDIIKNNRYDLITAFRFFLNAQDNLRNEVMLLLSEKLTEDGVFIFNIHGYTRHYYLWPKMLKKKQNKLRHESYFKMFEIIRNSKLKIKKFTVLDLFHLHFTEYLNQVKNFL